MATDLSTTIDVPELEKMVKAEEEKWKRRSIFKLPPSLTNTNKTAYTPQMVSFVPYHYEDEDSKQMEWHKRRAVNRFLNRSNLTYGNCFRSLLEIVEELMAAYDWLDPKMDANEFLDIMIRDGAFMLEIFGFEKERASGYAANDPIFSEHGKLYVVPHVIRDILKIENQIPMKVLHKLFQLQFKEKNPNTWQEMDANQVVFQFFFPDKIVSVEPPNNSLHVLDMYLTVMLGKNFPSNIYKVRPFRRGGETIMKSAVEFTIAGVKIKRSNTRGIRDISFQNGVLKLPRIVVDDTTESLFLNLIAYERFHVGAGNDVTYYVFFMSTIIRHATDIQLLYSKNILENEIGSESTAAKLFSSMGRDISVDENSPLSIIHGELQTYCKRIIPGFRIDFYRSYFTNAWAIVSFLGVILLFILTLIQTSYGIKEFYKR